MFEAYSNIFRRCGLKFRAVEADTGNIGGSFSHEFMVLAETGEDWIANCLTCDFAANLEKAEVKWDESAAVSKDEADLKGVEEVETPDMRTIEEVTSFLDLSPQQLIKTLIFKTDGEEIAVLLRGDHELNEAKLKSLLGIAQLELADPNLVEAITGAPLGFAGPMDLKVKLVADHAVKEMENSVTGGNRKDLHLRNVNMGRDFTVDLFGDLRVITPEDDCPRCGGEIRFGKGIEVGHVFKLGTKYSTALSALFLDEQGGKKPIVMGCYGIGVGRTVAAAIEQYHDQDGILFPIPIAPFEVVILPLQMHETKVCEAAEKIYRELSGSGIDVLIDDRETRAGVKFKDADLLGTPVRVTVGMRSLQDGRLEMKVRSEEKSTLIPFQEGSSLVKAKVRELYDQVK